MPPVWRKLHRQYIRRRNIWHFSKIMCYLWDRDHCILNLMVYNAKRKNILTAFQYSHAFPVSDYLGHLSPGSLIRLGPGTRRPCLRKELWLSTVSCEGCCGSTQPGCAAVRRGTVLLNAHWGGLSQQWEHLSTPSDTVSSGLTDFQLPDGHWLNPHGNPPFGFWSEVALPLLHSHCRILWELERLRQIIDTNYNQRRNDCHCKNVFINDLHIILREWYSARQNCNRFSPNGNFFLQNCVALKGVKQLNIFPPVRKMTDQGQETIH